MKKGVMEAPKCPICDKELNEVYEDIHISYKWMPDKDVYIKANDTAKLTNTCPYCKADLIDIFPDGV